jgi:hypothetical protein
MIKMGKYQNNKRELLKHKCLTYLGGKKCVRCGVDSLPICCYDFHHKTGNKEIGIGVILNKGVCWSLIQNELDKCEVLCRNCHAIKHAKLTQIISFSFLIF